VVARPSLKEELEPVLLRLGLEHEWVTGAAAAARACSERRFEVALVDDGLVDLARVMAWIDLRGRRLGRAVIPFHAGEGPAPRTAAGEAVPVPVAAEEVLRALSKRPTQAGS